MAQPIPDLGAPSAPMRPQPAPGTVRMTQEGLDSAAARSGAGESPLVSVGEASAVGELGSAASPEFPRQFGKYRLQRELGCGASGTVYLALDTLVDRTVALKVLDRQGPGPRADRQRFLVEARSAAQLNDPRTVAVYDINESEGVPYIAMEWMQGGSTQDALDERGPIPWREATAWLLDACRAVASLHQAGMLHRDIKPGNLLLTDDGRAKLGDFGLVKFTGQAGPLLTLSGGPLGTPSFMSPEQCRAEPLDECADVYSLGATYFALLTGHPPYHAESTLGVMFAHCSSPPPSLSHENREIPAACDAIVERAMAKDPSERFASATDLAEALERLLGGNLATTPPRRPGSPGKRRWWVAAALTGVALAPLSWATWRPAGETPRPSSAAQSPAAALLGDDPAAPPTELAAASLAAAGLPTESPPAQPAGVEAPPSNPTAPPAPVEPNVSSDGLPAPAPFPELAHLGDHKGAIADLDFLGTGDGLIAIGTSGALAVWRVEAPFQMLQRLVETERPKTKLFALGYFPRRKLALTGGASEELALWDLETGTIVARAPHPHGTVRSIDVSPDERRFVTGGDLGWNLWQLPSDRQPVDEGAVSDGLVLVHSVRYSRVQHVVAATSGNGLVRVHSFDNPANSVSYSADDQILGIAFSQSRCELVFASQRGKILFGTGSSRIKPRASLTFPQNPPRVVEFAPNRPLLALGHSDGTVTLVDLESNLRHRFTTELASAVTVLRFSRDGEALAIGNAAGDVLWARLPVERFTPPTSAWELALDRAANLLPPVKERKLRSTADSPAPAAEGAAEPLQESQP